MVGDLSAGERQRVEIIRCLLQDPKLLIMDEPTSVLTPQEVEILFRTLRQLSSEGTAILYISHKLEEIQSLCDEATILRRGKVVATCTPRERTAREMAELMVGAALTTPGAAAGREGRGGAGGFGSVGGLAHSVRDLAERGQLHGGARARCWGSPGWPGNGQDELAAGAVGGVAGRRRTRCGSPGQPVGDLGPVERRRAGLVAAPEDRYGHAAAPDMSLVENAFLTAGVRKGLTKNGLRRLGRDAGFCRGDHRRPMTCARRGPMWRRGRCRAGTCRSS